MHARIDQLLSVLDREPVDASIRSHIEQCPSCTSQLGQLTDGTEQLRALPQLEPPELAWQKIAAELQLPPAPAVARRWRGGAGVAVLAASVLMLIMAIGEWREPKSSVLTAAGTTQLPVKPQTVKAQTPAERAANVRRLVEQSRQLEQVLEYLPQRPAVERLSMAANVDSIEQRVQWLDFQLSAPPEGELNAEQTQRLWSERVTLMDSLVKLRYAQSGRVSF